MSANKIERFRGDTYPLIVTLKENGNPVDLSSSTVTMSLKMGTLISIVATVTDAVAGISRFDFSESIVSTEGKFKYDISVDDGSHITTYVKDDFVLVGDVK